MRLQILYTSLTVLFFSLASCVKDDHSCSGVDNNQFTKAIITGYDMRKCACCGGLMITFSGNPQPNAADFNLVANSPSEFGITEQTTFPVYILVQYKSLNECGNKVQVTKFKL